MGAAASKPAISDLAQRLCVRCGLCCDGTLFNRGRILPEDDPAQLAANGFILISTARRTGFLQPCLHHQQGICTIYRQRRPQVCHTFRCALLRRFDAGELSLEAVQARIERALALAGRIQAQLPAQSKHERQSLKQRMAVWQQAQASAGVDMRGAFAPLLLDFASLQRLLDQHFRLRPKQERADAMSAPDTERFTAQQGAAPA